VPWSVRFRLRQYLRGSLWVVPLIGAALGLILSEVAANIHVSLGWHYSPSTATTVLSTVGGAMVGLIGFVVTVSVLVVQMATGTFSARYMRLWYRDRILKAVLAWLLGTFTFSYSLLRRVSSDEVPNLGVTLAGVFVSIGLMLFLVFLDRFIHRLRPVAVAALAASAGRRTFADTEGRGFVALAEKVPAAPEAEPSLTVRSAHAGTVQALDRRGLVGWAVKHDCLLVLPHAVGDFVSRGTPLVEVYGTADGDGRELRGMFAFGVERTIEQDVAFALRIMVDVAIKALSAAVNDPTTAIQVLDHLGDMLQSLGKARGLDGRFALADEQGRARVLLGDYHWNDLLALGVTEIREYGASSIQVMRRLRALLEDLRESVRPEYVDAIDDELARLDATVAASFGDTVDHDVALLADRQGIGGPLPVRAPR
jgi:uncharacterized membrane protein